MPAEPVVFGKWTSAICGPDDDIVIPRGSTKTDWEVELGVVIGTRRALHRRGAMRWTTSPATAWSTTCPSANTSSKRGGTWDKGKGCDTFGPIGPWLVTADEVPDPQTLRLWLEVDGHRYQDGNTATMIFGVANLVSYLSHFMSLQPGDVISTGTPPGVGLGQKPEPVYLRAGQTVRLGIDGLGEQRQRTVDA